MPTDVEIIVHVLTTYLSIKEPKAIPPLVPPDFNVFRFLLMYFYMTPELDHWEVIYELIPNEDSTELFGNIIRSDGFAVDFLFYKRKIDPNNDQFLIQNHTLNLDDFNIDEIIDTYRPSFIDPGRKSVFTAVTGLDPKQHAIKRCNVKEYYHLTGSTAFLKKLNKRKDIDGITAIKSATPTAKTARNSTFRLFANHLLANMDRLFTFYNFDTAKSRFNLYQGRQRAPEIMVNTLLNGGTKYNRKKNLKTKITIEVRKRKKIKLADNRKKGKNKQQLYRKNNKWRPTKFIEKDTSKVPLIIFGNGMFGKDLVKLKGLRCGAAGIMWRCLKKRESVGDLLVALIDEFRTSKICNKCVTMTMDKHSDVEGQSVLACTTCNTTWQRNVNAAKNMMSISLSVWAGKGRPEAYSRN